VPLLLLPDVKGDLYPVRRSMRMPRPWKSLIQQHLKFTGSQRARNILLNWDRERKQFKKVNSQAAASSRGGCPPRSLAAAGPVHLVLCKASSIYSNRCRDRLPAVLVSHLAGIRRGVS